MTKTPNRSLLIQSLLIIAAGLWVFYPAFNGDWLWDDGLLIRDNAVVRDPAGLWETWFDPHKLVDYFPLTVSVEWLEWRLWPGSPLGYHLVTFALHLLGAFMVWRLLARFNLRFAWLGGLLFAIHPVVVESVAWMSELKNTLSLPPFLWAICFWIDYERDRKPGDYIRALALFLLAMLGKTTMVMFPFIILLYALWKRGRIGWNDLKNCAPFLLVSLALGLVTIKFMHPAQSGETIPSGGIVWRFALAGMTMAFYFSKCVCPVGLMPIYSKWIVDPASLVPFLPWVILTAVIAWCSIKRQTWGRHVLLGLGFFLLNLAPFVGFNQAPYMSFTWVMDHILYLPLVGLIGLAVAGCGQIDERLPRSYRPISIAVVTLVAGLMAIESHAYAGIFLNQETLWAYTLQGNPDSDVAHNNLGLVYLNSGRLPQAIDQFEAALKIKPDYAYAQNGLGNALVMSGRTAEAIDHYREALRVNPIYPEAHNGLGNALLQTGHLPEAQVESETALKLKPGYAEAHCTLGLILAQQGHIPEAIDQFETAQRLTPGDKRIPPILDSLRAQLQNPAPQK